jgi:hypothetical protein
MQLVSVRLHLFSYAIAHSTLCDNHNQGICMLPLQTATALPLLCTGCNINTGAVTTQATDVLCPNETELELMCGTDGESLDFNSMQGIEQGARLLALKGTLLHCTLLLLLHCDACFQFQSQNTVKQCSCA